MPKSMPDKEKIEWKKKFEDRYKQLLGDRYEEFKEISMSFLRRSIRVNTLKIDVQTLKKRLKEWQLKKVPWCEQGFWINHVEGRRDIGNTIEHSLGYFYVQEAASMIPPVVLGPKPGEKILDMCASPGSKASQIAQYMKNEGVLIANDYLGKRIAPLGINMQRMGVKNEVLTLMEGRWFKGFEFDRILVDAPCSGTGTIRKSLKTLRIWNPNMVRRLAGTQRQLLETAFNNVKEGGTIVYSTCTLEPEEDEGTVSWLLERHDDANVEKIDIDIKRSEPIMEFNGVSFDERVKNCLRIYPQDNDTEGFFVCKLKKE